MGDYIGKPKTPLFVAFRGSLLSLGFRPPSGGREEPKSEARRAENARLRQRVFLFAALGPKGLRAPWNPRQGVPPAPHALQRPSGGPAGAFAEGQGCRGKSAPDTLPAGLGRSGRVKGPCPRPCGAAGRTNPLTRPPLEKRARGPRRGLRGTVGVDGGQGSRSERPRSGLALTPRNDPNAPGWWLGVLFPQPPATWRTPPEAAGGALDLLLLRAVSRNT